VSACWRCCRRTSGLLAASRLDVRTASGYVNDDLMNAAIYARVSTTDQSCEMQLLELREYAARRGWKVIGEYVDTGWTGLAPAGRNSIG
jgi:hypothetical protein